MRGNERVRISVISFDQEEYPEGLHINPQFVNIKADNIHLIPMLRDKEEVKYSTTALRGTSSESVRIPLQVSRRVMDHGGLLVARR